MSNLPSSPRVIFSKKYGHVNILWSLVKWPILNILLRKSREYVVNKKQLVVFSFDYIGHCINLEGIFENKDLETVFDWLKQYKGSFDGTAIDIGANIGNHSLYFSDFYNKVVSFEPNMRTFKVLALNVELAKNIECYNFGISSSNGNAEMHVNKTNMGGSFISTDPSLTSQSITLQTLDSVIDDSEVIKLLKVDVEGHDYDALLGSENTIKRNMPVILFEQHDEDFVNGESKVIELLKSYGYSQFAIVQTHPRVPSYFGFALQGIYALVGKLIFGESMRIIRMTNFAPALYRHIIAIPDWMDA